MNQTVRLIMGYPASGKSSIVADLLRANATGYILSRDTEGGKVIDLLPKFKEFLAEGADVILDNLFMTVESRRPFIEAAQEAGAPIECHWMQTSFEDCQVNALNRMWDRYGCVFMTMADIKAHPKARNDPNMFPIGALFHHRARLLGNKKKGTPSGKPTMAEGFSKIVKVPFVRRPITGSLDYPYTGKNRALILDYDGTLRKDAKMLGGQEHYPTRPEEVKLLLNRADMLRRYVDQGYMLLGVTTQSGIGKGSVSEEMVVKCLDLTNALLGFDIEYHYCPHHNFPPSCYCRKPQPGLGIKLIRQHDLDPSACLMVGDQKTDETFAQRCGFQFVYADEFFGRP